MAREKKNSGSEPGSPSENSRAEPGAPLETDPPRRKKRRGDKKPSGFEPASALEKAKQRRENPRALIERTPVEGNIMEYPLFALNNRDAKPMMPDPAGRKDEDGNPLLVPDLARYTRTQAFEVVTKPTGHIAYRTIVSHADTEFGYPNVIAFEVFVYLCQRAQELGFSTQFIPFTYYDFCDRTGRQSSGRTIQQLKNAIAAMLTTRFSFKDAWNRRPSEEEIQAALAAQEKGLPMAAPKPQFLQEAPAIRICSNARLIKRQNDGSTPSEVLDAFAPVLADPEIPYRGWIKLGDEVFASLKNGYRYAVDPDYLFALKSPLAKRLYVLLTKRDDRKGEYQEDVVRFAKRTGLRRVRSPGDAIDGLKDALDELTRPIGGKALLSGWRKERKAPPNHHEWKLIFTFKRPDATQEAEFVRKMHEYLKAKARSDLYERWFKQLSFTLDQSNDLGELVLVHAPNSFHRDFIQDNYQPWFRDEVVPYALGRTAPVRCIDRSA